MMLREQRRSQRRAAFTLMEMLVVVAIIVALASIGGFFLLQQFTDAKKDIAQTHVKGVLTPAVIAYSVKGNRGFPPGPDLEVLLTKDVHGGPYLESREALIDPWGNPYQYNKDGPNNNGTKPDIWCVPPGAQSKDEWIGNWPKAQATK